VSNGLEAVRMAEQVKPDIILMDLIMPAMDGVRATAEIRRRFPETRVIALTSFSEAQLIHDALQAGASGCILKTASAAELANAIRSAHIGNTILSPELSDLLLQAAPIAHYQDVQLTPREKEVLALMVAGKTNAEISEALTLSLSTVKFHVSNILSKLNTRSRGEAILYSLKHNLVDPAS